MLKSLEIHGFKSFADRTHFEFHSGITAIVGPNGSGKSNVVDAVKWILGDQSAKSLRGKEMTDVIFNGAAGRKSAGMAEATLTFDNSSGFLPSEFQEVQVGRRITSSGDSEYLINRATARLKDVRELFMGTGAGSSAYAILEQGRVDQILQANATSRRQVFEEAAGISRYSARKAEALRKLERVEQNLLRLTDIVDEVEARLNSTRNQAAKAAKFRDVSRELKDLWLGLAADDHRHLGGSLQQIETNLAGFEEDVAELSGQLTQVEEQQAALEVDVSEVDDRLREVEKQGASNRETIARHDSTIRHQTARQRELELDLGRLRIQASRLTARAAEATAEREHNAQNLSLAEEDYSRHRDGIDARERRIRNFHLRIDEVRSELEDLERKLEEHSLRAAGEANRAATLESRQSAAEESRLEAERRSAEIEQQADTAASEGMRHESLVKQAANLTAEAETLLLRLQQQRESLLREHSQFQRSLAEQRERRSAWQARMSVLEDLENRQEGLGIGVKEILSRAQTSNYPPWNCILGSAADLLTVDLEHAALLEVAIGDRSQLIVVQEYDPLIEYFAKGDYRISGRVGFVVTQPGSAPAADDASDAGARFDHFRIEEKDIPDLTGQPGVLDRADRFVQAASEVEGLAARLLSDTWIVETLEIALTLSAEAGRGCRFVTRLGELLEADGTIVVGSVRAETAIVSRKSELRGLKRDIQKLDRKIVREEKRLAGLDDSLSQADEELACAQEAHREVVKALSNCQAELTERQREIDRLLRELESARADAGQFDDRQQQLRAEKDQSRLDLAAVELKVRSFEADIARAKEQLTRRTQRLETLEQRRAAEQLDSAKSEERLRGMRGAVTRIERDLEQRRQQQAEADRRFQVVFKKNSQITLHMLNTSAALAEMSLLEEDSTANAALLLQEKQQLRDIRAKNQRQIDAIRQQHRDRNDERHQEEISRRDIRNQIQSFAERIEEEYQVDLDEIVATGKSAYAGYLDELRAERGKFSAEGEAEPQTPVVTDEPQPAELQSLPADESEETSEDEISSELPCDTNDMATSHETRNPADEGLPSFEEARDEMETRVNRLRRRRKLMGSVNTESLDDLDELEERHRRLSDQLTDLVEARNALDEIIRRINIESERKFTETFASIRTHFQELFRKLFGGGEADIVLEDPNDVLECGIDVVARPPGKELRSISLLSGGEKTMTAVGLLLAIFKSRPSPFCILDEVDAALDEANLGRFVSLLKEFRKTTQFIMISHRKPSMSQADVLYGVTMEQSGVSKRMTVRFEDVGENGNFKSSVPAASNSTDTQSGEIDAAA